MNIMLVGITGYYVSLVFYLFLLVLLLISWRSKREGVLFVSAIFISVIWSGVEASISSDDLWFSWPFAAVNTLHLVFWVLFLSSFSFVLRSSTSRIFLYTYLLISVVFSLFKLEWLWSLFSTQIDPKIINKVFLINTLLICILLLHFLEQFYRNTSIEKRWAVKYLFLGLALIAIYELYFITTILMTENIDEDLWAGRGYINAIVAPFFAVTVARNKDWAMEIYVSKKVAFHTATIFIIGAFMLITAALGYYVRIFGGSWGGALQILIITISILLSLIFILSVTVRTKIKVFINKHFFNYKYDYRDEWLLITEALTENTGREELQKSIIRTLTQIMDCSEGLLWVKKEDGFYCVSSHNTDCINKVELWTDPFVTFLEERDWVINVSDYNNNPDEYVGLVLPEWVYAMKQIWLIIPMRHHSELIGFVVLVNPRVRRTIDWEDRDLLKTACKQAASYLVLLNANEALSQAEKFAVFNRLSAYVVHDLNNLIAQLGLVVKNAEKHKNNPAFLEDAFLTVSNATGKMGRLLEQLKQGRFEFKEAGIIKLNEALSEITEEYSGFLPVPEFTYNGSEIRIKAGKDRFYSVIGHLIRNAQEATQADGFVTLHLSNDGKNAKIEIKDNGSGMDQDFINNRLFHPFDTTKGNAGMGVGVYESREFIRSIGGKLDVNSTLGKGSTFTITLPLAD